MMNLKRNEFLNFSFRVFLNRHHLMVRVVMVGVSVYQDFPASQEVLDPRDQQVLRDHIYDFHDVFSFFMLFFI